MSARAPWLAHFGFTRTPFGKGIAAPELFTRDAHVEAVARLGYCIAEGTLGLLMGDGGVGKTVAVRAPVAPLDRTHHAAVYVGNRSFGTRGLYVAIVAGLGATPRFRKPELIAQTQDLLAAEAAERHRRVGMIFDEAHLLTPEQLEELRLLTSADLDATTPFAGLLIGQPTHTRRLRMGVFAALDPRLALRYRLEPMDLAESIRSLQHHLALVGRQDPLFAEDACARLHRFANGVPRALNNAATAALIAAAADGKALVDDQSAKRAVAELPRD